MVQFFLAHPVDFAIAPLKKVH